MDSVVFGPRRVDGTGEGEDVFGTKAVIGGGSGGIPVAAVFDGVIGVCAKKCAGTWNIGRAADVFEAPMEGLDATVVVGGPATVLVTANFAFKPVHRSGCKLLVYSC